MQVELKNGNFDYSLLQSLTNALVANSNGQSSLSRVATTFRAGAPQFFVNVDRVKAERIGVTVGQVFSALSGYVGSGYVSQFDKFGHVFQIYTQAEPDFRATADDIKNLKVKAGDGTMTAIGTVIDVTEVQGPSLISLYNLYPSSTVIGSPAAGFSSGQALDIMDQIGKDTLPAGAGFEWTAMSFQEKQVGNQIYYVFGLALLLVYFVLAGQYESWVLPLAVILGVPLALLGTVAALTYLGAEDVYYSQIGIAATNLYTQIGLILLIALGSKNAILIVEYARQRRAEGMDIVKAAVEGGAAQVSADPHDVVRLHSGRAAARAGDRRRRRGAHFDRHCGLLRDDRLDLPRRRVRAVVLRGDAAHRRTLPAQGEDRARAGRGGAGCGVTRPGPAGEGGRRHGLPSAASGAKGRASPTNSGLGRRSWVRESLPSRSQSRSSPGELSGSSFSGSCRRSTRPARRAT